MASLLLAMGGIEPWHLVLLGIFVAVSLVQYSIVKKARGVAVWEIDEHGIAHHQPLRRDTRIKWEEVRKIVISKTRFPPRNLLITVFGTGRFVPFSGSYDFQPDVVGRYLNGVIRYTATHQPKIVDRVGIDIRGLPEPEGRFALHTAPEVGSYRNVAYAMVLLWLAAIAGLYGWATANAMRVGRVLMEEAALADALLVGSIGLLLYATRLVSRWWKVETRLRDPARKTRGVLLALIVLLTAANVAALVLIMRLVAGR